MAGKANHVLLGVVTAAHGLRGEVKVKSFTDPPMALGEYAGLCRADGAVLRMVSCRPARHDVIVKWHDITSREQAEALIGTEIFIDRAALPEPDEDDFYYTDLIGCRAITDEGEELGTINQIHDFGAGDILEIGPHMIAFTRENVPQIDLVAGRVTVCLPPHIEADGPAEAAAHAPGPTTTASATPTTSSGDTPARSKGRKKRAKKRPNAQNLNRQNDLSPDQNISDREREG